MTTSWSEIVKPVRGATTDGANVDGTRDGAYTPYRGDGILVSDGDWMPALMDLDIWYLVARPVGLGVHLADGSVVADGRFPAGYGDDWERIIVS